MTNRNNIPGDRKAANQPEVPRGYDKLPEHMPEREPIRADEPKVTGKAPLGGDPSEGDAPSTTRH